MQSALEAAVANTVRNGARRIHLIRLRVGQMSGVVPEALASAFAVLSPGTPAEGARLDIDEVATVCHCSDCAQDFRPDDVIYVCPRCGQISADVRLGHELELASLEVS